MSDQSMMESLSNSIAKAPLNIDWKKAFDYSNDEYGRAAFFIVEPEMSEEDEPIFGNILENDTPNWIQLVSQCSAYDPNWIKLATLVSENGY